MSRQVISSGFMRSVSTTAMRVASSFNDRRFSSALSMTTVPAMVLSCRVMLLRMVDLPAPLGPMRVTISPFSTSMVMSRIRVWPS